MSDLMGADLPPALGSVPTPVWKAFDFGDLLTLVFLKQLRHIADGAHACYQAVTETPFAVTALSQAHILDGDYDITIPRFDSVPLAADFGLLGADSQGDIHQQAKFAYFLNFDFRLKAGKEVWVGP